MTMEFEAQKRGILRPTFSINLVQHVLGWERQRGALVETCKGLMAEKCCYNELLNEL